MPSEPGESKSSMASGPLRRQGVPGPQPAGGSLQPPGPDPHPPVLSRLSCPLSGPVGFWACFLLRVLSSPLLRTSCPQTLSWCVPRPCPCDTEPLSARTLGWPSVCPSQSQRSSALRTCPVRQLVRWGNPAPSALDQGTRKGQVRSQSCGSRAVHAAAERVQADPLKEVIFSLGEKRCPGSAVNSRPFPRR